MAEDLPKTILIEAERVKDLFCDPDLNLASKTIGSSAGLESLKKQLYVGSYRKIDEVKIKIASNDGFTEKEILEAIKQYCRNKITENKTEIKSLAKAGRTGLIYSIVITLI